MEQQEIIQSLTKTFHDHFNKHYLNTKVFNSKFIKNPIGKHLDEDGNFIDVSVAKTISVTIKGLQSQIIKSSIFRDAYDIELYILSDNEDPIHLTSLSFSPNYYLNKGMTIEQSLDSKNNKLTNHLDKQISIIANKETIDKETKSKNENMSKYFYSLVFDRVRQLKGKLREMTKVDNNVKNLHRIDKLNLLINYYNSLTFKDGKIETKLIKAK